MPDTYTSQFSGEEIDSILRAVQILSGASTPAELRKKLEIRGDTIPVSAEDSTLISGAVKYRTNPNLLDNWYFGRPVNQRGQTEYTAVGYTVDRWKIDIGGAVTLEDGCVCLKKSGTYWGEYFDDFDQFIGMTLTGSVLLSDGTLRTGSFVYNGLLNQGQTFFSSELGFYIQKLSSSITQCEINSLVDNVKIKAVKLELGDAQTLAHKENGVWVLNEIPDFGEQLARCQRYFVRLGFPNTDYCIIGDGVARDSQTASVMVPLPTKMRTNFPAAYITGQITLRHSDTAIFVSTTASIDAGGVGATLLKCVTSGLTTGDTVEAFLEPQNYVDLSADL